MGQVVFICLVAGVFISGCVTAGGNAPCSKLDAACAGITEPLPQSLLEATDLVTDQADTARSSRVPQTLMDVTAETGPSKPTNSAKVTPK